jgi:hypothetical protein
MRNLTFFIVVMLTLFFSFTLVIKANAGTATDQIYLMLKAADGSSERTFLVFSDAYTEGFRASEDATSMTTYYTSKPAVWTIMGSSSGDFDMFVNGVPMRDNREVKIGFSVIEGGKYTFVWTIDPQTDLKSAILVDRTDNKRIDMLSTSSYEFSTDGSVNRDRSRFKLLINFPCLSQNAMYVDDKLEVSTSKLSGGAVHVAYTGKIDIKDDASAKLQADTIIFYSNDNADGLLRNLNTNGGVKDYANTGYPKVVIVRKTFTDDNFTVISLPFDVSPDSIFQSSTGRKLNHNATEGDYWAWEMDIKNRADMASASGSVGWKEMDYSKGFKKTTGYMFWSANPISIDFVTTNPVEIERLFSSGLKSTTFNIYGTDNTKWNEAFRALGNGWAYIGGLNTTTYAVKGGDDATATISGYDGVSVWIRNKTTSQATGSTGDDGFNQYAIKNANPADDVLNLAPYTPFYVQYHKVTAGDSLVTFGFKGGSAGLLLESVKFRSSREGTSPVKDQLFFVLSSDKDNSRDRFYLNFSDDYTESYRASEDAVKLSASSGDSPAVWSIQDGTNSGLFINGLPLKDGREVKIGYSAPEQGDYTMRMDASRREGIRTVVLVDNVTGKKVDLLQYPYTFNTNAVKDETGRFTLYINSIFTGVPSIEGGSINAFVKDNILTVKNLSEGDRIQALDLAGRTVVSGIASGKEFSAALSQKGVYVVDVRGEKTTVLKVLNK